jgi:ABC-type polysaccharide/polyol phosphate transport system ATPase subunit
LDATGRGNRPCSRSSLASPTRQADVSAFAERVASLLEVGTGFHPELTGRENIYLNGAILGMPRLEIRRKFDEIVEFAEIGPFLDTPVKHYSSGMYVRLAFAVAAHLEPEVLIVDEVLAVGDIAFQKKCLGKMQAVSTGEGRTVLFVSHNIDAVRRLCHTAIMLAGGRVCAMGQRDPRNQPISSTEPDLGTGPGASSGCPACGAGVHNKRRSGVVGRASALCRRGR